MDAYSGYNQIPMAKTNEIKTMFVTELGNYYYKVMPFRLRNAGATYQRMMNKVYDKNSVGDIFEVYMDDMIVKSEHEIDYTAHLKRVFEQTRKYNMRLNLEKMDIWGTSVQNPRFLSIRMRDRSKPRQMLSVYGVPHA
jgi:hypothetical protein